MSSMFNDQYFMEPHEEDYLDNYDEYIRLCEEREERNPEYRYYNLDNYFTDSRGIRWKYVPGFSNYMISETGVIVSQLRASKERALKTWPNQYGHLYVGLINDNGEQVKMSVHRLVAMAFVKNNEDLPIVMHRDDNPANNDMHNLTWGTQRDNIQDCIDKGRNYTRPVYCYDTDTVYRSGADAADDIGVAKSLITLCCQGKVHSVNGMIFCYLEDKENLTENDLAIRRACSRGIKPVRATNVETGQVMIFESRKAAANYLGIPDSGISNCLSGFIHTTHGWAFEDVKGDEYYEQNY